MEKDKDYFATPSEKVAGDISMLKEVQDVSELSEEEKKQLQDKVKDVANSVMSSVDNISFSDLKEKQEILKNLQGKGIEGVDEVLGKMNEITNGKLDAPITLTQEEEKNIIAKDEKVSQDFNVSEEKQQESDQIEIEENVEYPSIPEETRDVPKDGSVEAYMSQKYGSNLTSKDPSTNNLFQNKTKNEGR